MRSHLNYWNIHVMAPQPSNHTRDDTPTFVMALDGTLVRHLTRFIRRHNTKHEPVQICQCTCRHSTSQNIDTKVKYTRRIRFHRIFFFLGGGDAFYTREIYVICFFKNMSSRCFLPKCASVHDTFEYRYCLGRPTARCTVHDRHHQPLGRSWVEGFVFLLISSLQPW